MIVVLTPEAEQDFEHVADHIAQFNPARSVSFTAEVLRRCQSLSHMPLRYQLITGHEESGIRRIPHGNYVIFYHVMPDAIYILHILNAAQDHEAILFPDKAPGD